MNFFCEKLYFTVFPKHTYLINFAENFGFIKIREKENGELVYEKQLNTKLVIEQYLNNPSFFYPFLYDGAEVNKFIIPIKPGFHEELFPNYDKQVLYSPSYKDSEGNSIKKAYLSHNLTKLKKGDIIFFYISKESKHISLSGLATIGIVNYSFTSKDYLEIASKVSKITVYPIEKLKEKAKKKTQVIIFDYIGYFIKNLSYRILKYNNILNDPPQWMTKLNEEQYQKLKDLDNGYKDFIINQT